MTIVADKPHTTQGVPMSTSAKRSPKSVSETKTEKGILANSAPMPAKYALQLAQELAQLPDVHVDSVNCRLGVVSFRLMPQSSSNFRARRLATAYAQVSQMSFYPIELTGGRELILAVNDDSHGEMRHQLDPLHDECDCDDFLRRCLPIGERCHHLLAYDIWKADGGKLDCAPVQQSEPVPGELTREPFYDDCPDEQAAERAARRKWFDENVGRDF